MLQSVLLLDHQLLSRKVSEWVEVTETNHSVISTLTLTRGGELVTGCTRRCWMWQKAGEKAGNEATLGLLWTSKVVADMVCGHHDSRFSGYGLLPIPIWTMTWDYMSILYSRKIWRNIYDVGIPMLTFTLHFTCIRAQLRLLTQRFFDVCTNNTLNYKHLPQVSWESDTTGHQVGPCYSPYIHVLA